MNPVNDTPTIEEKFDLAIEKTLDRMKTMLKDDEAVRFAAAAKDLVEARRMWKLDEKK